MEKLWKCDECGALLGIHTGEQLEIKVKGARWRVRGALTAQCTCARCGQINEREFGRGMARSL